MKFNNCFYLITLIGLLNAYDEEEKDLEMINRTTNLPTVVVCGEKTSLKLIAWFDYAKVASLRYQVGENTDLLKIEKVESKDFSLTDREKRDNKTNFIIVNKFQYSLSENSDFNNLMHKSNIINNNINPINSEEIEFFFKDENIPKNFGKTLKYKINSEEEIAPIFTSILRFEKNSLKLLAMEISKINLNNFISICSPRFVVIPNAKHVCEFVLKDSKIDLKTINRFITKREFSFLGLNKENIAYIDETKDDILRIYKNIRNNNGKQYQFYSEEVFEIKEDVLREVLKGKFIYCVGVFYTKKTNIEEVENKAAKPKVHCKVIPLLGENKVCNFTPWNINTFIKENNAILAESAKIKYKQMIQLCIENFKLIDEEIEHNCGQ